MKHTMYIAGKISGLPYRRTWLKFYLREQMLRLFGFYPLNPMRLVPNNISYKEQMEICLDIVPNADCIYLSHNWRRSSGVIRELNNYIDTNKTSIHTLFSVITKQPKIMQLHDSPTLDDMSVKKSSLGVNLSKALEQSDSAPYFDRLEQGKNPQSSKFAIKAFFVAITALFFACIFLYAAMVRIEDYQQQIKINDSIQKTNPSYTSECK